MPDLRRALAEGGKAAVLGVTSVAKLGIGSRRACRHDGPGHVPGALFVNGKLVEHSEDQQTVTLPIETAA